MSLCLSLSSYALSARLSLFLSLSLVGSLFFVHTALTCSEGQSACTLAHSLLGEHVRIIQETFVYVFLCKPRATSSEAVLYPYWRWRGVPRKCDVCATCVCACWYVLICDVVCCRRCDVRFGERAVNVEKCNMSSATTSRTLRCKNHRKKVTCQECDRDEGG